MAVAPYCPPFGAVKDAISVRVAGVLVLLLGAVVVGAGVVAFWVVKSVTEGSRRLKVREGLGEGVSWVGS